MRNGRPAWLWTTSFPSTGRAVPAPLPLLNRAELADLLALAARTPTDASPRPASRAVNGGEGRSIFIGRGMDYAESRLYQPGDDVRAMHWSLLARTGNAHVRLYHEEHTPPWHVLVDLRPAMAFGTRVRTKMQQAARVAVLAAAIQARHLPQSVLAATLWTAGGWTSHNLGKGIPAIRRLGSILSREILPDPGSCKPDPVRARSDFTAIARRMAMPPHGRILTVISDFSWLDPASGTALRGLGAVGQLRAMLIRDPAEIALPRDVAGNRHAWFYDETSGQTGMLAGSDPAEAFAAATEAAEAVTGSALREARAIVAVVTTTDDALTVSNRTLKVAAA